MSILTKLSNWWNGLWGLNDGLGIYGTTGGPCQSSSDGRCPDSCSETGVCAESLEIDNSPEAVARRKAEAAAKFLEEWEALPTAEEDMDTPSDLDIDPEELPVPTGGRCIEDRSSRDGKWVFRDQSTKVEFEENDVAPENYNHADVAAAVQDTIRRKGSKGTGRSTVAKKKPAKKAAKKKTVQFPEKIQKPPKGKSRSNITAAEARKAVKAISKKKGTK